ncbi:hypothetical protein R1538_34555 [Rhizobium leguminosarum]|uniref:hypothetical protein n=1 Tax=Rhizobium leguminosarum TaxID=384 RepID=UPI00293DC351|nr:hypothetical protein [Rhizobium leguminosarum]MDV4166173.1 hypothetical protein [Rhizobium leguminosarum]
MDRRINFWTCISIGSIGAMRATLAIAEMKEECTGYKEVRYSLFKRVFCVSGATDKLARQLMGDAHIDALYAKEKQKAATTNPYFASRHNDETGECEPVEMEPAKVKELREKALLRMAIERR